ncbi:MAG: hypothetical protein RIE77_11255 [Phycisphaerales bacterium]|jgi:hypothetical protein
MRWGRAIRTLLVFILLGMLATVLSSWAIHGAQWFARNRSGGGPLTYWHGGLTPMPPESWPAVRVRPPQPVPLEATLVQAIFSHAQFGIGWLRERHEARSRVGPAPTNDWVEERLVRTTIGWPWPAMRRDSYEAARWWGGASHAYAATPAASLAGGLEIGPPPRSTNTDRFALPLLPLWPGCLLNAVFYALLLFGASRLPGALRRALRQWRGRCIGCGYSREGLDAGVACPECGAVAGHPSRRSAVAR